MAQAHINNNVELQQDDPESTLNFYKSFLEWRRKNTVLINGDILFIEAPELVLAVQHSLDGEVLTAYFNLSPSPVNVAIETCNTQAVSLMDNGFEIQEQNLILAPFGFAYL